MTGRQRPQKEEALRQGMVALLVVAVSVQVAEGRGTGTGAGGTRSRKTEAASKEKTEKKEEKKEKDNNNKKKQEQEHGIARQQLICKQGRKIRGYCAVPGDPGSRSRLFTLRLKRRRCDITYVRICFKSNFIRIAA